MLGYTLSMNNSILIVDDCHSMRSAVKTALRRLEVTVVEAEDASSALSCIDEQAFDLIISDVHMPGMDGIEFAEQVRGRTDYKSTPICMLTIDSDAETMLRGKTAGATAWLVKPFRPEALREVVKKLVA